MLHCPLQRWRGLRAGEQVGADGGDLFVAGAGHRPGTQDQQRRASLVSPEATAQMYLSEWGMYLWSFLAQQLREGDRDWAGKSESTRPWQAAQASYQYCTMYGYYSRSVTHWRAARPRTVGASSWPGGAAHKRTAESPGAHPAGDLCRHNFCRVLCKVLAVTVEFTEGRCRASMASIQCINHQE